MVHVCNSAKEDKVDKLGQKVHLLLSQMKKISMELPGCPPKTCPSTSAWWTVKGTQPLVLQTGFSGPFSLLQEFEYI